MAKEVSRDRGGYYDPGRDTAGPGLGKLFHAFYQALGPAQTLLEAAGSSETLRNMVIESCLGAGELAIRDALTADAIARAAQTLDAHALAAKVKQDLAGFAAVFDQARNARINERMRAFWVMLDLVSFDYHGILRKLDPAMPRDDYVYVPRFAPVESSLVATPLKDFLEILPGIDPQAGIPAGGPGLAGGVAEASTHHRPAEPKRCAHQRSAADREERRAEDRTAAIPAPQRRGIP
jgi:hypothetical protein